MPVDSRNAECKKYEKDYQSVYDFLEGERRIKEKGSRYTPPLEKHRERPELYDGYKEHGTLYNAFARTVDGFAGCIMRKLPKIDAGENAPIKQLENRITKDRLSYPELVRKVSKHVLGYGRFALLPEMPRLGSGNPYLAVYGAENIWDWLEDGNTGDLVMVKLVEPYLEPKPDDPFELEERTQIRILRNGEYEDPTTKKKGKSYYQEIYRKKANSGDWEKVDTIVPRYKGLTIDQIPFVMIGAENNSIAASKPPLLDLLNLNIAHWKLSVSYHYGLWLIGLPTPVFSGFSREEMGGGDQVLLGPGGGVWSSDPAAKASYMEFTGQGLGQVAEGMRGLEDKMAISGARLLEQRRPGVEAAETVRQRSSGDSSILALIAGNIEDGMTRALNYLSAWMGGSDVRAEINKDYIDTRLSPQEIAALVQLSQAGKMSDETLVWNLQQGEMLPPGRTVEDEMAALVEDQTKKKNQFTDLGRTFLG